MTNITDVLTANRAAVDELVRVAETSADAWTTPRAPGKWSPQQVIEHVARSLEEGANVVAGRPTKLPTLPALVRPVVRVFFNRIVKTGKFPRAKTNKAMNPDSGPSTAAEARSRLHAALAAFERECRARAATDQRVVSGAFGTIAVEDYVRFTELHTRHHIEQVPVVL